MVCCSGGYIYKSENSGQTWTAVESGIETIEVLRDIVFYDDKVGYSVGDNNAYLYTVDGGEAWNAGTGPAAGIALFSVAANDKGQVFVGTNDARLMRSEDGTDGTPVWEEWLDLNAGSIDWIEFDKFQYVGYLIHNTAALRGYVYKSEDGGADWFMPPNQPVNSGLNDGHVCDANNVVVTGNVHGATTFIAKLQPSTT